uniref:Reverse transcriptase domain-containing protein n=1 Tax=Tanacetum cinerariifolium TaxID=118510 RepID=A0A6L2LPA3_TANCI|nr:hypothetical protein [Tanacetum cinerariifolium]
MGFFKSATSDVVPISLTSSLGPSDTVTRMPPYPSNYLTRRLTMEEILAKFIDEGKCEHGEMEIFIKEFRTTNELLLKEQSNLLSELKIEVNELSKVMGNVLIPKNKVKGVTTRGGKMTSEASLNFINYIVRKVVPPNWTFEKRNMFYSQVKTYFLEDPYAFKLYVDNIMRRCVAGSANVTAKKVYKSGFYWTSIFKDDNEYVRRCDACQRSRNISSRNEMPQNIIQRILERSVRCNPKDWSEKLNDALWTFRTSCKTPTWCPPFRLVYGKACHLSMEIEHKSHWALKQCNMDLTLASKSLLMQLNELAKLRDGAYENTRIYKERTKKWHDSRLRVYSTSNIDTSMPPYLSNYPTRRLTMEEMLAKFIDEGKCEHEEMEIFIKEFRTTNEILLKEQSNLLRSANVTAKKVYKSKFYRTSVFKDDNDAINSILERLVRCNPKDWSEKLNDALWAFRTSYKTPTWCPPFRLVYGKACHLSMEIEHKSYWALKQCNMDSTLASKSLLMQLNELAKLRDGTYENTRIYKERTKKWHDSRLRGDKDFKSDQNIVKRVYPYGAVEIIDKNGFSFKVIGQRLNKYYKGFNPTSSPSWGKKWLLVQIFYENMSPDDRERLDQFAHFRFSSLNKEEGWNLIQEYARYQDDSWDDSPLPMNISFISKIIKPTLEGRLRQARE